MHNKRISLITSCFNFVVIGFAVYTAYLSTNTTIQEPYWILTVIYAILFTICVRNKRQIGKSPGNTTLNIIMFLRYALLPIVVMSSGDYGGLVKNYSYISEGLYLMSYELVVVFLSNEFFLGYIKPQKAAVGLRNFTFKRKNLTIFLAVSLLLVLVANNLSLVQGFGLIIQGFIETELSSGKRSSFVSILWQALTTWVFVYLVLYWKMKYDTTKNKMCVFISIFLALVFILITFIAQTQISRWYTVISAIASVYFLIKLFPVKKKSVILLIMIPIFLLMMTVTIYKNVSIDADLNYDTAESVVTSSDILNVYLAGPSSVNNAIGLYETKTVGLSNLPYDMLNNMPIINHMLPPGQTTVYKYNYYIGRVWEGHFGDQIIPLIGQGLAYFGPIFCVLISIIMVFFIRLLDLKFMESDTIFMFLFAFLASWFGAEMCLNMTINLSWIYIRIFPMWLLFYLTDKIKL